MMALLNFLGGNLLRLRAIHCYGRHVSSIKQLVVGIQRENQSLNERRAPLSPANVAQLVRSNVKVIVQPSTYRVYPNQEYISAGAVMTESLEESPVILGIKPPSIDNLLYSKTYAFLSQIQTAQQNRMPLLNAILEKNIRLIEYSMMVDHKGKRIAAFGIFAGIAGTINILHGLGQRLLALGYRTPFMNIGLAQTYRHSSAAKEVIREAGEEIKRGLLPNSIGPVTFVLVGEGNVSMGAQDILRELPHEYVESDLLHKVATEGGTNKIYVCIVRKKDHLMRISDSGYDKDEFMSHPERYHSCFSSKIAPYTSVIVNGILWSPNNPRLITLSDAKNLQEKCLLHRLRNTPAVSQLPQRLLAICDISADIHGSIEFTKECTTIDRPFQLFDAVKNRVSRSFAGDGVLMSSIQNLPTQLPLEATDHFGKHLLPFVYDIAMSDATSPFDKYKASPLTKNAVITSNGSLTERFQYIDNLRKGG